MKKTIFFCLLFTVTGLFSFAQEKRPHEGLKGEQKIKALYIAYITQELQLTEEEAVRFWPVHLQFDKELKDINLQKNTELEREEAALRVKKSYLDRFTKVLGAERTQNFFRKDEEFRLRLLEKIRKHQMEKKMKDRPKEDSRRQKP